MSQPRIDLSEIVNEQCVVGCNKGLRSALEENTSCKVVSSVQDELPIRCVGPWAREKIYFLTRYFNIFASGMHEKWGRSGVGYFEIGCGPGRCIDRKKGIEFDGSALAILKAQAFKYINVVRFIDIEANVVTVLNERIRNLGKADKAQALVGSYTNGTNIARTIRLLNPYGLNLIFIDPTDCSVPFSTLKELKGAKINFDLIINIAIKTDFSRNIGQAIDAPDSIVRKKYESFLGNAPFFASPATIALRQQENFEGIRASFIEEYKKMLRGIGFQFFGRQEINGYYELLFASCHPLGLNFWKKATEGPSIEGQLPFDL